MPQVPTVLGPVGVASLGRTLMHEHIFILTADVQQNASGDVPPRWKGRSAVQRSPD
jgi:phosphotriesterase-related protein